jgi:3-(3-hydroxy-phenyl)propionate hydroxylase
MSTSKADERPVLIAGGGPVGVITALALARRGVPVQVFEAQAEINDSPRASTLHPATLEMLAELGLLEEVTAKGLVARTFQFWDRPSHRLVAEFDHAVLAPDTACAYVVQCEQHKLVKMCFDKLTAYPHATVSVATPVENVEASADGVAITVERPDGNKQRIEGSYLVGADGGRSLVRKAMNIDFDGYTFPERFLVLTTPFDFGSEHGVAFRAYFSDPDEWANLFKVAGDDGKGRWRAVFPTLPGQTDEDVMNDAATEARLQKFFPKTGRYDIFHRNIYNVHQHVAVRFREGRVFLAGDCAHVNNPIGGLGLNSGIHDATHLAELIADVHDGKRRSSIFDSYDKIRRPTNIEYVQQQTIANKKRLEERDPAAREANFEALRAMAADPAAHRAFLLKTSLIESVRKIKAMAD